MPEGVQCSQASFGALPVHHREYLLFVRCEPYRGGEGRPTGQQAHKNGHNDTEKQSSHAEPSLRQPMGLSPKLRTLYRYALRLGRLPQAL